MPNLFEVIRNRRSVREFSRDKISREDIKRMIECATWAPSANNRQMWKFMVVTNQKVQDDMSRAVKSKVDYLAEKLDCKDTAEKAKKYGAFFGQAPVVIAVLHEPYKGRKWEKAEELGWSEEDIKRLRAEPGLQSIGGAVQNMLLAAEALGYCTCWMTLPVIAAPEIESILGVKAPWELAGIIPVGKPAKIPEPGDRKPWKDTVEFID